MDNAGMFDINAVTDERAATFCPGCPFNQLKQTAENAPAYVNRGGSLLTYINRVCISYTLPAVSMPPSEYGNKSLGKGILSDIKKQAGYK